MGTATWHPKWWTKDHASSWERAREAMKRDWEQTKDDLGMGGRDLDQDVGDTVKQATGKEPIPPPNQANPPDSSDVMTTRRPGWDAVEEPFAYGYAARQQYNVWDDRAEADLRSEWENGHKGGAWDDVKRFVRRGYDSVRH